MNTRIQRPVYLNDRLYDGEVDAVNRILDKHDLTPIEPGQSVIDVFDVLKGKSFPWACDVIGEITRALQPEEETP